MTLREQRVTFTRLLAELILWCFEQGWQVAIDEGKVFNPRRVRIGGLRQEAEDAVHVRNSFHYRGLACDLLLYDDLDHDGQDDDYVSNGDDPRWKAIAIKWESLHPLATSGRRWRDSNHVSLGEGSKDFPLPA